MSQSTNIRNTGKETIIRTSKNSMRKDMCLRFFKLLSFILPICVLTAIVHPKISDFEGYCIMIVGGLMGSAIWWLLDIFINKGSMIESISFDYDLQMLELQRTDLRNRHRRMEIPFEGLSVGIYRADRNLKSRAYIYSHNKKKAVLVFSFGWVESDYDKVKYQLETYLPDKIR